MDKKLEKILRDLPPDVQGELIQMIRRDPSIARCLAESEGREKQIIHAVRAGRAAGSAPMTPSQERRQSLRRDFKRGSQNMFRWLTLRPKLPTKPYDELTGVHPDFAAIAQGAYHNAMVGVEHDHDGEHHDDEHEHHQHDLHLHQVEEEESRYRAAELERRQAANQPVNTR